MFKVDKHQDSFVCKGCNKPYQLLRSHLLRTRTTIKCENAYSPEERAAFEENYKRNHKKAKKNYKLKNPERISAHDKKYTQKNPEKISDRNKRYKQRYPEKIAEHKQKSKMKIAGEGLISYKGCKKQFKLIRSHLVKTRTTKKCEDAYSSEELEAFEEKYKMNDKKAKRNYKKNNPELVAEQMKMYNEKNSSEIAQ